MSSKLPIALVSGHSGLMIPPELDNRIALTPEQIFNEADAYIDDIFDFRDRVFYFETFDYGRAILDMNRPADPKIHHRPGDGVVKRVTSYGDPVYYPGTEPEPNEEQALIQRYWQSWHDRLARIGQDPRVKLVIDCHSMAAVGPSKYDDPSERRPRAEVANLGDERGQPCPPRNRISAPPDVANFLAKQLGAQLSDIPALTETGAATAINRPFFGGWNLWAHGHKGQPWLMVELNRALYVGDQDANTPIVPLEATRRDMLQDRLWPAIEAVTDYVTST